MLNKKLDAFTLTELLIVLVIIGILVLLALPNFMGILQGAHSKEAEIQLKHLHTLQDTYKKGHFRFGDTFEEIGYVHQTLLADGGTAKYQIDIVESDKASFKATATATEDFDDDGQFNVWEIDQTGIPKEVVPD